MTREERDRLIAERGLIGPDGRPRRLGANGVPLLTKAEKKTAIKKGEAGYFERNVEAAHAKTSERLHEELSIFPTTAEFERVVAAYFAECDENRVLYGEAGLCLALTKGNKKGRTVTVALLRKWHDGDCSPHLQEAAQRCYLRIQNQIETSPIYREKGMVPRSIFLQKQTRFGGYQDKVEEKRDTTVRIITGSGMEQSDFE